MGHIRKGILGGFSGKVGTVVGASWKRTMYMRSLPKKNTNQRSLAQRTQMSKFAIVVALLRPLTAVLRIGWKRYANHQSAYNACTAYTLANAITGEFPNHQIDYKKVMISRGNLTQIQAPTLTGSSGKITITWKDNSGIGNAKETDKLLLALINPTKNEVITRYDETERSEESVTIDLPHWTGNRAHIYMAFASEDGKDVSDSICYPSIQIV